MKIKRTDLVTSLVDCFGYSINEFDGVDKKTIIEYMTDDQKAIVRSYLSRKDSIQLTGGDFY